MKRKLNEKAVTVSEAGSRGLALHISSVAHKWYVLYDASSVLDIVNDEKLWPKGSEQWFLKNVSETIKDFTLATVSVDPMKGEMWDASTVQFSAAQKGYGPLLYDIVMALEHGIASDRESVTAAAKNIWNNYLNNRPDVEHKLIDDINDPKTPPHEDDGELHNPKTPDNSLNYAYFLKNAPNVSALLENDKKVKNTIRNNFDMTLKELNMCFVSAGRNFFQGKYPNPKALHTMQRRSIKGK